MKGTIVGGWKHIFPFEIKISFLPFLPFFKGMIWDANSIPLRFHIYSYGQLSTFYYNHSNVEPFISNIMPIALALNVSYNKGPTSKVHHG